MIDVREYWDFSNPVASREAFEALLPALGERADQLDVMAQIARTYSLSNENQACLDYLKPVWDEAMTFGARPQASCMIEAARAHRGLGDLVQARKGFEDVTESTVEDLVVDALHMLALVTEGEESESFNQRALDLARESKDEWARRWVGSLYNNLGWAKYDAKEYEEALEYFESALAARYEFGQFERLNEAKWCIGRTLCELGRIDDARLLQQEILGDDSELSDEETIRAFAD